MAFIVNYDTHGVPACLVASDTDLWKKVPKGGILRRDNKTATVFATRKEADGAIDRTLKYDAERPATAFGKLRNQFSVIRLEGLE